MLESKPPRAAALVVGVDHYDYGEEWRLIGPASDALHCVDWLIARGVQRENIALFLSERSWQDDMQVTKWVAHNGWKAQRRAQRDEIVHFVDRELPKLVADAVFIYWGGHGVVDNNGQRNCLYTEDAADGTPYCVCVQDLMSALHGQRFRHLAEQIAIIDACANPFSDTGETAQLSNASFAQHGFVPDTKQFQMFAASVGKMAANVSERKSGLFSGAIFKKLHEHQSPGWPDFHDAFETTLTGVEALKMGLQQPFLVIDWPGEMRRRSGKPPGDSPLVTSLLPLVSATGASPGLLKLLYLRSLPDTRRAIGETSIERWLRDLDDSRPRTNNYPPPLIEFAERLKREVNDDGIGQWVVDNTDGNRNAQTALYSALDAELKAQRPKATLFMEIAADRRRFGWWLDAPDPKYCGAVKDEAIIEDEIKDFKSLKEAVAKRLRVIMAEVEQKVGHKYEPVVSFILPDALLSSGLESTTVIFEEDGLPADSAPLNKRYPVTLHWHKRVMAISEGGGRPINAWKQALTTLTPRINAGGGADVVWLESAALEKETDLISIAAETLLSPQGTSVCVGLGHLAETDSGKLAREVIECLKQGVPCFFWLAKPLSAGIDARKELCDLFSQQKASEAPVSIGRLRKATKGVDLLSSICMVWDEPGYLPSMQTFESPAQGDTT